MKTFISILFILFSFSAFSQSDSLSNKRGVVIPVLPIKDGGTNNGSLSVTAGTIYYGDGTKLIGLAPGTANQVLHSGTTPSWKDTTTGFTLSTSNIFPSVKAYQVYPQKSTIGVVTPMEIVNYGTSNNTIPVDSVPTGLIKYEYALGTFWNIKYDSTNKKYYQPIKSFSGVYTEEGIEGITLHGTAPNTDTVNNTWNAILQTRSVGLYGSTSLTTGNYIQAYAPYFAEYDSSSTDINDAHRWYGGSTTSFAPMLWLHSPVQKGALSEYQRFEQNDNSATGAALFFRKSRGTFVSKTADSTGDIAGSIIFTEYDSNTYENNASISSVADTVLQNGTAPQSLLFKTSATVTASIATRLRIWGNGKVSIGTNVASALLTLDAPANSVGGSQLKFTTGTPPTTPEIGSMNFKNGLWLIDSSNSVRDTIAGRNWARNNITSTGGGSVTGSTGDIISFSGTNTASNISAVASGSLFASAGTSTKPVWSASPTLATSLTVPLLIGGNTTTSPLTFKTTTGAGTTNADIIFQVGNNGGTEAMRILNSGNVGIGDNNPTNLFSVLGATNGAIVSSVKNSTAGTAAVSQLQAISDAGTTAIQTFSSTFTTSGLAIASSGRLVSTSGLTGGLVIDVAASAPLIFGVNNNEAMRINGSNGHLLIATTSDIAPLTVTGAASISTSVTTPSIIGGTGTASALTLQTTSGVGATDQMNFNTGNAGAVKAMTILSSGIIGINNTSPSGGQVQITNNQNAATRLVVSNTSSSASARAGVLFTQNGTTQAADIEYLGSGFSAGGGFEALRANSMLIAGASGASGGLSFGAFETSAAPITFTTGGTATANERMRITSTGLIGIGRTPTTDILEVAGNISLTTAGNKLKIATGTNASLGTATLASGTVTVSTTAVTASSKIFLTDATTGALTNVGSVTVGTITAGTSFVINSTNVLDASTVNWLIIN